MLLKKRYSDDEIPLVYFEKSAQDETRTHMPLPALPPQSSVSTNFTTCANAKKCPEQGLNLHVVANTSP